MPTVKRPGFVPFLLTVTAAAILVLWNGVGIVRVLTRAPAAKAPSTAVAGTPLDRAAEEIRALWEQPEGRQTDLALRAMRSCDTVARHRATFQSVSASAKLRETLSRAGSALSEACDMRLQFARVLPEPRRVAAERELRAHHSLALGAIESARAQLLVLHAAAPGGPPVPRPSGLLDNLVGLLGGLICLLFARRPRAVPQAAAFIEEGDGPIPADAEPASYGNTALRLLDDSGSFFFSEVFDRAPVPLVLLDGEGKILRLNAEAESLAGQTTAEVRSKNFWDVLVPKSVRRAVRESLRGDNAKASAAETWATPGGTDRSLVWKRVPFMEGGTSGRPAMILLAGQALAEPSSQEVSEEANTAMIELENELTLIAGHSELLNTAGQPSELAADLRQMEKAVEHALDAVRRLLADFGRRASVK